MKIIAIVNNKGGVGKTTTSRILAEYFSIVKNERVLAIDMDPQANFSNRYLKMEIDPYQQEGRIPPIHTNYNPESPEDSDWDGRSSIAGIFFGEMVFPYSTYINTLEVAPSHSSKLLLAEAVTREEVVQKVYDQLSKFLELDDVKNSYDKIIIDTPPSKGPVTISVVRAATDLLIPSIMEPQPIEGIYGMIHLWKSETLRRPENRPLNLIGVLPNSFDRRGIIHKDHYDSLKQEMPDYVLDSRIGRRLIYAEADADGAVPPSIFMYPEKNPARQEVVSACQEIEERMNAYVN
ncbi:MAG: ParA family protein [Gammaproteobacteria bacterium]|nr:ParA family protein [Gammaproteobacteria bacterium]MCW5584387.1 ParA family protein [Gammaproteobacteria bacterium]